MTITVGGTAVECEFDDTETARKVIAALPFQGSGSYWGGEFYFSIPVKAKADATAREVVDPGTVAFWVSGSCLCLFWGATPVSEKGECRAASEVNVVGRVRNPEVLPKLKGSTVRVEMGE
ncbi:MAG: cyclophilin-like fold protein [Bryobacteraceae bacterium]